MAQHFQALRGASIWGQWHLCQVCSITCFLVPFHLGLNQTSQVKQEPLALESPVSAMPMDSLRFMPPESAFAREKRLSSRFKILRMRSISSGHLAGG